MRGLGAIVVAVLLALPARAALLDAYRTDADYLAAQRAVATADDALAKAKADPEATPMALARARDGQATAGASLALAETSAKLKIYIALTDVLVARQRLALSTAQAAQAQLQLHAAEIKLQAGAIAPQERNRVRDTAARAGAAVAEDARTLAGAQARLQVYGPLPNEPLADPPALDPAVLTVARHPRVVQAQQQANEAKRALDLARGPDTAPLDLVAAQRAHDNAVDALRDVTRLQHEALDAGIRRYQAAREKLRLARESLALAVAGLDTARQRFDIGAISRLALADAEVAELDSQAQCMSALTELWLASFGLWQAAGGAA